MVPKRITQGIERNDIGGRESRHWDMCVLRERKRGVGVGKELTAS